MNTETIVVQGKKNLDHTYKGKKYKMGIQFIPQSELETFEKASAYLHESFILPNADMYEEQENDYLDEVDGSRITRLSSTEKKKRIRIRNKALDSLLKVSIDKARYKDHLTPDPCNLRYVAFKMMHRTPVKEADLQYNQRITDLITRAKNKEFSDDKVLDKKTKNDKEEFLGHFRKMLKSVENYDLDELVSKEWTDEELAEHAGEIFQLNSIFTDYQDVPGDLRENFGITDPKCERTIQTYDRYANFFQILNSRLACITSLTYDLYEPKNEPDFLNVLENSDTHCPDPLYADGIDMYRNYLSGRYQYVGNAAKELFSRLGISTQDVSVINPDAPDKGTYDIFASHLAADKNGNATFVCEKANIKLTFNVLSDELPKALAQNRISELIDKTIVKDPAPVDKPNEVAKPAEISTSGKIADFFTGLFTGRKPRQEAYNSAMTEYNNYQAELKKYNDYVTGHNEYLAVKDESEAKERLVTILKEKEAAIDKDFQQYKIDSDLERNSLRFGFLDQIDFSEPQIKNDVKIKDLMQKELSGSQQPQVENKQEPLINIPEKDKSIDAPEIGIPNK